jgi:hypothetical protein
MQTDWLTEQQKKEIMDMIQMNLQSYGSIYSFDVRISWCCMYGDAHQIDMQRGRSETIKTEDDMYLP